MKNPRIIVSLDLGTSKILVVVFVEQESGVFIIAGYGIIHTQCLDHGIMANYQQAVMDIQNCVRQAEEMAGLKIDRVYVGISDETIQAVVKEATRHIEPDWRTGGPGEIRWRDVQMASYEAANVSIPQNHQILQQLPIEYLVDERRKIKQPIGLLASTLGVRLMTISGDSLYINNLIRAVNDAGLKIVELVSEPFASSFAVLDQNAKEVGCAMLDLGHGTTDLIVFYHHAIAFIAVINQGGQDVTQAICEKLHIPLAAAEDLKINYGLAHPTDDIYDKVPLPAVGGRPSSTISRGDLGRIIQPVMKSIFETANEKIHEAQVDKYLHGGIILTGGAAKLRGLIVYAETVFHNQVILAQPSDCLGVENLDSNLAQPECSTALGLGLYAIQRAGEPNRLENHRWLYRLIDYVNTRIWLERVMQFVKRHF